MCQKTKIVSIVLLLALIWIGCGQIKNDNEIKEPVCHAEILIMPQQSFQVDGDFRATAEGTHHLELIAYSFEDCINKIADSLEIQLQPEDWNYTADYEAVGSGIIKIDLNTYISCNCVDMLDAAVFELNKVGNAIRKEQMQGKVDAMTKKVDAAKNAKEELMLIYDSMPNNIKSVILMKDGYYSTDADFMVEQMSQIKPEELDYYDSVYTELKNCHKNYYALSEEKMMWQAELNIPYFPIFFILEKAK